jgi:hypothetical protein
MTQFSIPQTTLAVARHGTKPEQKAKLEKKNNKGTGKTNTQPMRINPKEIDWAEVARIITEIQKLDRGLGSEQLIEIDKKDMIFPPIRIENITEELVRELREENK